MERNPTAAFIFLCIPFFLSFDNYSHKSDLYIEKSFCLVMTIMYFNFHFKKSGYENTNVKVGADQIEYSYRAADFQANCSKKSQEY